MIDIKFWLHGDIIEAGSMVPCLLDSSICYSEDLVSLFPFEGEWLFRVKEPGIKYGVNLDYIDLKRLK